MNNVNLAVQIQGHTDDGTNILNTTKEVHVPVNTNRHVTFDLPANLSAGNYQLTIDGLNGFGFHEEADLVYVGKSITGFIQMNKLVYKTGETVRFRMFALDSELKPPRGVRKIQVKILDPESDVIRKWSSTQLHAGVFENELQIAPTAMLGTWKILALMDGEELASKTFVVEEYGSFDVEVIPTTIPLEEHQALNLTISAYYNHRKPVKGLAKVELYLQPDILDQKTEFEMYGEKNVELQFERLLEIYGKQQIVRVKTTVIEEHSNRTVVKESQIPVYTHMYRIALVKESPQFRSKLPFKCALQFRYHDGRPAKGVTGKVQVVELDYEITATSDDEGLIKLELYANDTMDTMVITFSNDDRLYFYEFVYQLEEERDAFIKLKLQSPQRMTFFVYYVMSKGSIIYTGLITPDTPTYLLKLRAWEKMIPKLTVMVATVQNDTLLWDYMDFEFEKLRNNFQLSIDTKTVKPGGQIELRMTGRPGAYVGLAAYDEGSLNHNNSHDLFWKELMPVYYGFDSSVKNESDVFHGTGLFVRTLSNIILPEVHVMPRDGLQTNNPITKPVSPKANIQELWLWRNATIGNSGTCTIKAIVPDTITSWNVTGFSIDPHYGFAFTKMPIQLTTTVPFNIVENLPYSVKRGEAVALKFTLFNNLEAEYIADVTLHNVNNQTEFVGRPVGDVSYTKSIVVPPNVGVPISFLVKARSLGEEMTVRVNASIMNGRETDVLNKVIRVMP
uniref:TEP1-F n=1 Tax=Anopheles culicifacies TaxID=139723 RepID=A0A182MD71_9DIPT